MRKKWIFFVAPPAFAILIAICVEVVMQLWNWLLPALFGWHPINFWQALGLLVLCRILFGSFRGGHGPGRNRPRRVSAELWEQMTPEEREKFRRGTHAGCGGFAAPAGESKEPA
jgi:hypothetical protein